MDLGDLELPVLVFGGPYGNLAATRALQQAAAQHGIDAGRCICTGDTVAYCAEPAATDDLLRDWGCHVVMGNCEEALASGADDCGCGFDAASSCSLLAMEWYRFARQALSASQRTWMGGLPRRIAFRLGDRRFLVVHGSTESINAFVFASNAAAAKQRQLDRSSVDVVIGGHCGLPFGQRLDNGFWLNAGVIGMPANDGTPDGWYLLLLPADDGVEAHWLRLNYPYAATQAAMHRAGVALPYADSLASGLWPSVDILSEPERAAGGRPIALAPLLLR